MGQKEKLSFEASYTLDILCFIDILLKRSPNLEDEKIKIFTDMLSTKSEKCLRKLEKSLPKRELIQNLIIPLIVADSEFKGLKTEEILGNPDYLINQFKKSSSYKKMPTKSKKFVQKEAKKVIESLEIIVSDLERLDFKAFWLMNQLPIIKQRIKEYQSEIYPLHLIEQLNNWTAPQFLIEKKELFVLSFSQNNFSSLLNGTNYISTQLHSDRIIRSLIEAAFASYSLNKELKPFIKTFKKNKAFIQTFKTVKKEHKKITTYLQSNLLLAVTTYLKEQFQVLENPHEYLSTYRRGSHKLAILFYEHMKHSPKPEAQPLNQYLTEVLEQVDLY